MTTLLSIKAILKASGLRATPGRVEVYFALAMHKVPLSHREVCEFLPVMDRVTVFRNLLALTDAEIAVRVDMGDHVWRFAIAEEHATQHERSHPHFTCTQCGDVKCLEDAQVSANAEHQDMLADAEVHIRGICESCR